MSNLNSLELQNLGHLIGAHETIANKLDKIRVRQPIINSSEKKRSSLPLFSPS
ncbi:TPA: hypothetical protein N2D04_003273 [Clostridium botulinum]|uniref:hypothetical protein n=1 Tax=Clostridium botulinum TaxID=1491 RepID=UPI001FD6E7BA|nr:hypothetical protein [Clostridium botulinum]MCJ8170997.1 hypothetical protein [Clostridium botulinum]HCL4448147.1 hypothetical protein [Clostridium botulinum]HCL4459126.1 hypothetical protein [Clostridium botulinum]HCL4463006.1 hypothetical protein [Clostridium botulinum]HCL4470686.1 hypothetical protein [Clostridium botulinum]